MRRRRRSTRRARRRVRTRLVKDAEKVGRVVRRRRGACHSLRRRRMRRGDMRGPCRGRRWAQQRRKERMLVGLRRGTSGRRARRHRAARRTVPRVRMPGRRAEMRRPRWLVWRHLMHRLGIMRQVLRKWRHVRSCLARVAEWCRCLPRPVRRFTACLSGVRRGGRGRPRATQQPEQAVPVLLGLRGARRRRGRLGRVCAGPSVRRRWRPRSVRWRHTDGGPRRRGRLCRRLVRHAQQRVELCLARGCRLGTTRLECAGHRIGFQAQHVAQGR